MLSKPKYLLIIIILFSIKTIGLCQFDMNCHVPNKFDNAPLEEALNKWGGWCKLKFKYKYDEIASIKIDSDEDLIPLKKALNKALEHTDLAWKERENNVIEILPRSEAIEFIKISNTFDGTSLEKVISIWGFNYGLEIDYNRADISGIKIYGSIDNEPLDIAFEKILSNTPINFTIEGDKKISLFVPEGKKLKEYTSEEISYDITISGILKDEDTGESLPFANVIVAGTTHGTTTNLDGLFTLQDIPSDTSIIELSYIGYLTKEVRLLPSIDLSNLEIYLSSGGTLIDEITVTAQKKEQILKQSGISKIGMTTEIASILPSTGEKDIFRSLQLLPGISGSNESSAGLYVRGGTPDQNLMILDGFTVYQVDHLYGFFSAFNSNAIKDIQLYKGGFEPKFGGRLSSVVDITAKDGNSEQFNAGFNLSFLSVNGFIESPFADGKGSFIITGRRSYQSFLYNKLFDSFTGSTEDANEPATAGFGRFGGFGQTQVQPTSYFYDLNAKVTYRPSIKDKITFSLYNGEDDLDNSRIIDNSSFGGGRFAELFGGGSNPDFTFANSLLLQLF